MAKMLKYFRQRGRGWVLSLIAIVGVVYLPYLGNPLVFDDLNFFANGVAEAYVVKWFDFSLRWLPYASLSWTYAVFNDVHTHFYHAGNLLLHATNVIFLFYLLRKLIDAFIPEHGNPTAVIWGSWLAALIFAIHPVAVFATGYVIQRSILMATLFVLLMQMAFMRGMLTGRVRWLALTVLCYFLAVFSKEHSVLAPMLLVALTFLFKGKVVASRRALGLTWVSLFVVAVLVTLRARGVLGSPYEAMAAALFEQQGIVASTPMLHLLSALTQAGLFFKYLFLWLLPEPSLMSVDMREQFISSPEAWQSYLGLAAFIAYGVVAIRLLMRGGMKGLVGFALLYPWLQFGVELVGIRVQEPFVLYRSYLWMPGVLLLIPLLLLKWPERRTYVLVGFVALLLIPLAWDRLWIFGDNYRLWNNAAVLLKNEHVPGADRIFYNRGQAEMAMQKWENAVNDFERVVAINPQLEPVHYILGAAYTNAGRYQDALAQYDAAIAIKSDDDRVYYAKGMTLKKLHRDNEAMQQMEQSCKFKNAIACLISSGQMKPDRHIEKK